MASATNAGPPSSSAKVSTSIMAAARMLRQWIPSPTILSTILKKSVNASQTSSIFWSLLITCVGPSRAAEALNQYWTSRPQITFIKHHSHVTDTCGLIASLSRFAGAFLLPRKSFPNEFYTARLDAFLDLKRRWGASIQAMVYRCKDLELIDDTQFTNLYKQISFRRWRSKEPLDDPNVIRIEQPRTLQKAALMLLESGKKHSEEVCAEIALNPKTIAAFWNVPPELFNSSQQDEFAPSLK